MKYIKFPHWLFGLFLLILDSILITFFWLVLSKSSTLNLESVWYFLLAGMIAIVSFFLGGMYISSYKSWDIVGLCYRIDNQSTCKLIIHLMQEQIKKLESEGKK